MANLGQERFAHNYKEINEQNTKSRQETVTRLLRIQQAHFPLEDKNAEMAYLHETNREKNSPKNLFMILR